MLKPNYPLHEPYPTPAPALNAASLLDFCHTQCRHCTGSILTWNHLPPIPTCIALRQLLHFAANDLPISLEIRMFLYPDIDDALADHAATLPQLCPTMRPPQF